MRLHDQVLTQKSIIAEYKNQINMLRGYMNLPKFHENNMVNVGDIVLRLNEMEADVGVLEYDLRN